MDSLFVILGGHVHRFTGFGVTALMDRFASSSAVLHVMANGWIGVIFAFLGFCAYEGRKKAFTVGIAIYAFDAALLLAAQDYLCIPFHAFLLFMLFRGNATLNQSLTTEAASA